MARAVLLALACAGTLAAGARYGDYSAAIMPQYGGEYDARAAPAADDYRDHSPDAAAHLDYKYEEVSNDKIDKPILTDAEEDNSWNKPVKKPRNEKSIDDIEPRALNKYKLDKIDKSIPTDAEEDNSWNQRVKRPRNEKYLDDIEPGTLNKYKLDESPKLQTKYRGNIVARHRNKNRFRTEEPWSRRGSHGRDDQQMLNVDEDESQLHLPDVRDDTNLENEHEKSNFAHREIKPKVRRKVRDRPNLNALLKVDKDEEESLPDIRDIQNNVNGGPVFRELEEAARTPRGRPEGRAGVPGEEDLAAPPLARTQRPNKEYAYPEYYDMQRLQNIKKNIATRRPKARGDPALITKIFGAPLATAARVTSGPLDGIPLVTPTRTTTHLPYPITEPTSTTSTTATPELSLAEKSRLSILRKAQMKESSRVNVTATDKPPVLLQVTQNMQTMVMVEAPINKEPWMRVKEVSNDTPERLKKVKRLMRQKLVANAKDFQNLTENWDDLVCEYVDVDMLDAKATSLRSYTLFLLTLPVVYFIY